MLYKEFEDKIIDEIVNTLANFNSFKKYNLTKRKSASRTAITDEAKNVTQSEYIPCMRAVFKKLSSILYSHHCMARFHSEYNEKSAAKHLKPLKDSENADMKTHLLKNRIVIWEFVQAKVIEVFKATSNYFFNLSVSELNEILYWTNKFLEVGLGFANPKESVLHDEVLSLCNRYMLDFKDTQFNNLKDFIATEEWVRLPLPDKYEIKEFEELKVLLSSMNLKT